MEAGRDGPRSEFSVRRAEDGGQRAEVRVRRSEVGRGQRPEFGGPRSVFGGRLGTGTWRGAG